MLKILMPLIIQGLDSGGEIFFFSFRSCPGSREIRFKMALKCSEAPSFKAFSVPVFSHYESLTNAQGSSDNIDYSMMEFVGNCLSFY